MSSRLLVHLTVVTFAAGLLAGCRIQGVIKPYDSDPGGREPNEEIPKDGLDQDSDSVDRTDVDGDGYDALEAGGDDCNDDDAAISPGAEELCNERDDDCDGLIDGQDPDLIDGTTWCLDADDDGYGDPSVTDYRCSQPSGYVADCNDCNDDDAAISPGAEELCNERDDDCDGLIDGQDPDLIDGTTWCLDADGDGYGDPSATDYRCSQPSGYVADCYDCDDDNSALSPGVEELCNDHDDDCDGLIDGRDPDLIDGTTWCLDADGDGYGDPSATDYRCSQPSGYVANCGDCDDDDALTGSCSASADDGSICASLLGTDDGLVPSWTGACEVSAGFSSYGGHCYYAVATHTTWPDARASCQAAGGYLATVTDAAENAAVQELNSRPYLGACDGDSEGTWTWITGEAWSWSSWAPREPNDFTTGEDCLELAYSGGIWNDIWCDRYSFGAGYVCEFESAGEADTVEPEDTGDTGEAAPATACGGDFFCLDLSDDVNRDHTYGLWTDDPSESYDVAPGVHNWTVADGSTVDFVIIDPESCGGASVMLTKGGETWRPSYAFPEEFVVNGEGASGSRMYVAGIASSWADPSLFAGVAATLTVNFADGTVQTILLENGVNLDPWNSTSHTGTSPDVVRVYEDLTYRRHIDAMTVTLDSAAVIENITLLDDASVHTGTAQKTSVAVFAITIEP